MLFFVKYLFLSFSGALLRVRGLGPRQEPRSRGRRGLKHDLMKKKNEEFMDNFRFKSVIDIISLLAFGRKAPS